MQWFTCLRFRLTAIARSCGFYGCLGCVAHWIGGWACRLPLFSPSVTYYFFHHHGVQLFHCPVLCAPCQGIAPLVIFWIYGKGKCQCYKSKLDGFSRSQVFFTDGIARPRKRSPVRMMWRLRCVIIMHAACAWLSTAGDVTGFKNLQKCVVQILHKAECEAFVRLCCGKAAALKHGTKIRPQGITSRRYGHWRKARAFFCLSHARRIKVGVWLGTVGPRGKRQPRKLHVFSLRTGSSVALRVQIQFEYLLLLLFFCLQPPFVVAGIVCVWKNNFIWPFIHVSCYFVAWGCRDGL